jgi:hypothetical protein
MRGSYRSLSDKQVAGDLGASLYTTKYMLDIIVNNHLDQKVVEISSYKPYLFLAE